MYGILVMAISDGLASVIGQKYGKKTYSLFKSKKSYLGSFVFLLTSFFIGYVLLVTLTGTSYIDLIIISLACAVVLTAAEGSLSYGLDNLVISPFSALLLQLFVKALQR